MQGVPGIETDRMESGLWRFRFGGENRTVGEEDCEKEIGRRTN